MAVACCHLRSTFPIPRFPSPSIFAFSIAHVHCCWLILNNIHSLPYHSHFHFSSHISRSAVFFVDSIHKSYPFHFGWCSKNLPCFSSNLAFLCMKFQFTHILTLYTVAHQPHIKFSIDHYVSLPLSRFTDRGKYEKKKNDGDDGSIVENFKTKKNAAKQFLFKISFSP